MLITSDLRLVMARLAGLADGVVVESSTCGPWFVQVIHIPRGERFAHHTRVSTLLLVASGLGSVTIGDWRATLLAGQVASLEVDQRIQAVAEGDEALVLALFHLDQVPLEDVVEAAPN